MNIELRDWFAVHAAAALVAEQRLGPRDLAARAYDVADALMNEREARLTAELASARDDEDAFAAPFDAAPLLDDAVPVDEREDELLAPVSFAPPPDRPGLARTQLELPILKKSAG